MEATKKLDTVHYGGVPSACGIEQLRVLSPHLCGRFHEFMIHPTKIRNTMRC
jgi:hypothetical protein